MNSANEQDFLHSCENKGCILCNTTDVPEVDILWQRMNVWNDETFVHLISILIEMDALLIVGAFDINTMF